MNMPGKSGVSNETKGSWFQLEVSMKTCFILLAICAMATVALAEDLVAKDGTVYRNVTIVSADPERMLIVHDGGGCQVAYTDLAPNSLTAGQRKAIAAGLKDYVARNERMEQLRQKAEQRRIEQEKFEQAQREKGLVLFEGTWMKPADRQEILANRELDKIEQQRKLVELEKKRAELRQAQLATQQEEQRFEAARNSHVTYTYVGYPYRHYAVGCRSPSRHGYTRNYCIPSTQVRNYSTGLNMAFPYKNSSIWLHAGSTFGTRVGGAGCVNDFGRR
jgi:hypothetical protein